ncbi:hypothetical protein [Pseudoalteromonas ulvae]|uniref:Uncharacterized protein n=1 Tax=Pseudoalteromonas ulvae TaxID=107327 RepID=A0A244CUG4_PSEDV|nr:hypothetical protein [Pseudoalteromonas ulvae]OUL59262.1 hypothetical protein B1199_03055 [Pseudoalteromonas ulvae]
MAKSSTDKPTIDKTVLITTLAELSILLGTEIEPASDVKALQQQIADAEQLLASQSDDDQSDDQDTDHIDPQAIEQIDDQNSDQDKEQDEPTVLVQATHTIWTQHQGERLTLLKGEQAMWPQDLADDHAQNGHVILLGQ